MLTDDQILERISQRIDEWEAIAREHAQEEAQFKSWVAARKHALIDGGESAAKAEVHVTGSGEWASRYAGVQLLQIEEKKLRMLVDQGVRYFEAWRSKYSAEKRAVG